MLKQYPAESTGAGSFIDNGNLGFRFTPSAEGQRLLDYYRTKYGVPLEVEGVPPEEIFKNPGLGGYFKSEGEGPGGYGGSTDPLRRSVYLTPDTSVHVLAHEAGHAYDPSLLRSNLQIGENNRRFRPALYEAALTEKANQDPGGFLNAYIDLLGSRNVMQSEATAQREAKQTLNALGIKHPEKNQPWFQGYPRSFIDKGIAGATAAMTIPQLPEDIKKAIATNAFLNSRDPFVPGQVLVDTNTQLDIRDERARRILDLALNPSYQKTVRDIESRTQTYLDRQLGAQPDDYMYDTKNLFWGGR
jgi:hypothetical protein